MKVHYEDRCPFCFSENLGWDESPSLGGGMYPVDVCRNCGSQMAEWEVKITLPIDVDNGYLYIPQGHEKEDDDNPNTFRVEGIRGRRQRTSLRERFWKRLKEIIVGPEDNSSYSYLYTGIRSKTYK